MDLSKKIEMIQSLNGTVLNMGFLLSVVLAIVAFVATNDFDATLGWVIATLYFLFALSIGGALYRNIFNRIELDN